MSSDRGTYKFHKSKKTDYGIDSVYSGLDSNFFSFKVALKKVSQQTELAGKNVKWTEEFVND